MNDPFNDKEDYCDSAIDRNYVMDYLNGKAISKSGDDFDDDEDNGLWINMMESE